MMWRITACLTLLLVVAQKGQAQTPAYVAEGHFVVDDETVQRYIMKGPGPGTAAEKRAQALASLNQDIQYFLTEINKLLATLQSGGLNLQIKTRNVEILSTNILVSGFTGSGILPATTALRSFEAWLSSNPKEFDFAILWTGFNLDGELGLSSIGSSYSGTICSGTTSSGVVEFSGYYSTVINTARYIAFILGASQDGPAIKNVMSPLLDAQDEDRWEFSSCAATDIIANIQSASCLISTSSESSTPSSSWTTYTGSLFDPDVICQRRMNDSRSYMCKIPTLYGDQNPSGDVICQFLACWQPGTTRCISTFPSEGLVCNPNGVCDDGTCVADSSPRSSGIEAGCVHGDQKNLYLPSLDFDGTCGEFIAQHGADECYSEVISTTCCATCNSVCTGPPGCECGDRASACVDFPKAAVCPVYKDTLCCGYCQGFVQKRSIFDANFNAAVVVEDRDPVKEEVTYEVVHESIVREVE